MREMYMDVVSRYEVENSIVDRNYCLELNIKVILKGDYWCVKDNLIFVVCYVSLDIFSWSWVYVVMICNC